MTSTNVSVRTTSTGTVCPGIRESEVRLAAFDLTFELEFQRLCRLPRREPINKKRVIAMKKSGSQRLKLPKYRGE